MTPFEQQLDAFFHRPDEDLTGIYDPGGTSEHVSGYEEQEEAPSEYVAFQIQGESWALPIGALREIVRVTPLTEVPRAAPALLGVMNLRGEVLPVFSLERRLGLASAPARIAGPDADLASVPRGARILVVRTAEGDAGLLVDAVREVVRLRASSFELPDPGPGEARAAIAGIARDRNQLYVLLDLEQVFR